MKSLHSLEKKRNQVVSCFLFQVLFFRNFLLYQPKDVRQDNSRISRVRLHLQRSTSSVDVLKTFTLEVAVHPASKRFPSRGVWVANLPNQNWKHLESILKYTIISGTFLKYIHYLDPHHSGQAWKSGWFEGTNHSGQAWKSGWLENSA